MKLHISLKVNNLEQAIGFYSRLFRQDPEIRREEYAKWEVEDPAVNFVIEAGSHLAGVHHFGIQAESQTELNALAGRMRDSGPGLDVEPATCCFAKMDRAWVDGMAGERWEMFLTHSQDEPEYGEDRSECCVDPRHPRQPCCPEMNAGQP
ncbi:MAG: glyoxalase/bleomycin resistance/dioxygenase family protein [Gammaproteobacteria bacterium]|nr:glyoxalase/bleomycin resistance/dioxygenase family protein [Gammaproteobacteria bacterium]